MLGEEASAEEIGRYMERATVCLGEGERIPWPITVFRDKAAERITVEIDTGKMLFLCVGAFEGLWDLIVSPVSGRSR